jgi:hypothetical protein
VIEDVQSGETTYFAFVEDVATDPLVSVAPGEEPRVV